MKLFATFIAIASAQEYNYENQNYEYADSYDYGTTTVANEAVTEQVAAAVADLAANAVAAGRNYGNNNNAYPANNNYPSYPAATGLQCWRCDADSFELCESTGSVQTCQANEGSCELEIRERNGYIMQIRTGCKAKDACEMNMAQNFKQQNPHYTECRPEPGYTHSVCRQCCSENLCVKEPSWWYPTTRTEWAYKGESGY
ncbi:Oidioi.mRNA.OKI2018_I69.PAR.g8763.t1.cds [Oikopleura dioica]|uniref:Oidioi.mRNA.OKI2018_I69.PAR.g8763.t1.cds n=1 Tax=Oikopleura dioica TaxID=34765 RepID=A0ABN7RPX6_OIKDI|nr:Oidioi.mRNA.OKI2018_I69.PAR.g8763.t1.cds [Oikopleura dioica]